VETIPLRCPSRRQELPTRYFRDEGSKFRAVIEEAQAIHETGRPVLIGSRTIENSEAIAQRFRALGIPFQLLNGRQDAHEAEVIAAAGQHNAVTVATNMAGRGTDIVLGRGVAELGGLHVIGVERHESQRIDRQLLGRAARQGDPGSGRFFVAADDALLRRYCPELCQRMQSMEHRDGEVIGNLSRDVARVQALAEASAKTLRRKVLAADDWLDAVGKALESRL
jgi:preprotein translocase subunit SecA